jgi:hypothetical protein
LLNDKRSAMRFVRLLFNNPEEVKRIRFRT